MNRLFLILKPLRRCAILLAVMILMSASVTSYAAGEHEHEHDHASSEEENHVTLTVEMAEASGLTTAMASSGKLQKRLKLFARINADPEQVRELTARFPGVVRSVKVRIGDHVQAGDVLATVEANESLRSYNITAPIAGTVVARQPNAGESTGDKLLFTLANYQQLVANVSVFPHDAPHVKVGQAVLLQNKNSQFNGTVEALTPNAVATPTLNARIAIDNSGNEWAPGEWVSAYITIAEIPAQLLIDNRALQEFGGEQVAFTKVGDTYEIRPLNLGETDGQFTEVLDGLEAGESYVIENSYLLKADLEKSGAAHVH